MAKKRFTEQELKCIARHLQQLVDITHYDETDAPDACKVCEEAEECWKQWPSCEFWWNLLCAISEISGVDILRGTTAEKEIQSLEKRLSAVEQEMIDLPNKIGRLILEAAQKKTTTRCGYGEGTTFFVPIPEDEPACSYAESIRAHEASPNDD